jgi:hypothetical protein
MIELLKDAVKNKIEVQRTPDLGKDLAQDFNLLILPGYFFSKLFY